MESSENLSPAIPSNSQEKLSKPEWLEEKSVNELKFCNELLSEHELRFIEDCFYNIDGAMPIQIVEKIVAEKLIGASVSYGIANKIKNITNALKHLCYSEEVPQTDDEIHVKNGVLKTDGAFLNERKFCHNRLNVTFAVDTSPPLRWISFMNELLEPEKGITVKDVVCEPVNIYNYKRRPTPLALDGATCPTHNEPVSDLIHYECGCSTTRPRKYANRAHNTL